MGKNKQARVDKLGGRWEKEAAQDFAPQIWRNTKTRNMCNSNQIWQVSKLGSFVKCETAGTCN